MTPNPAAEIPRLVTRTLHLALTSDARSFELTVRAADGIIVLLGSPGAEYRGQLGSFVVHAIEEELERLGATPPSRSQSEELESQLSDQLYRARLLGNGGLGLRFQSLDQIADENGQLGLEDSRALRALFQIAQRDRLQLYLPESTAALRVVGAPERLGDWLSAGSRAGRIASIEYEPPVASSAQGGDPGLWSTSEPESPLPPLAAFVERVASSDGETPAAAPQAELRIVRGDAAPAPIAKPAPAAHAGDERDDLLDRRCESWAAQLDNMSGPKVHGSVERAFLTAYLPLCREVVAGKAPPETERAVITWAEGFAQSYATAFKNLGSRPKRPKMVKDVIDISTRWLSQHRARQCQLLLVDGMRFDLGQRLNEELEQRLGARATCVDQALLWAALPSNADAQQIGEHRIRSGASRQRERSEPAARVESLRLGMRELFRLDQLTAELSRPGEAEPQRLSRLARSLADNILPWLLEQPADTLVVIFGDHGYHWQTTRDGTGPAQRGGALPEQVLVPASAWLLGDARPRPTLSANLH